jgi:hypothetical protein
MDRAQQVEDSLDEALAETFPASDPPFFIASGVVGAPPRARDTDPDGEHGALENPRAQRVRSISC